MGWNWGKARQDQQRMDRERQMAAALPPPAPREKAHTTIDTDTVLQGNIRDAEQLTIKGTLEGNAEVKSITLSKGGRVVGNVKAELAIVEGEITGQVRATRIILLESARISGPVSYAKINLHEGAVIQGEMNWMNAENRELMFEKISPSAPQSQDAGPLRVVDGMRGR